MSSNKPFYITTTLPYVNSDPHIGFAMEIIRADVIARWKKLLGYEVFFNTGTDEHGAKIHKNAVARNISPQEYVDEYAAKFKELIPTLGILSEIKFTRTTDAHHVMAAQEFWKAVEKNGYIYKKSYSAKYCVGCELEKTESELVDGKCPLHPLQELEIINEENYFFKFSAFQKQLLEFYKKENKLDGVGSGISLPFVVPESRLNEIRSFVERDLRDFSISRLKEKMPWGIPVPGDGAHVMYVWFDALVNYVSATGWPDDVTSFKKWCEETGGMVQYCGKDNLRQQSAMWQAMLMAAGLPTSRTVIINGFITGEGGIKMSKSLGNVVNPLDLVREYGVESLRYYVTKELSPFEDSPFTLEKFKESYNANLANGLGNLVSRVMKMSSTNLDKPINLPKIDWSLSKPGSFIPNEYVAALESFNIQSATNIIWKLVAESDGIIQKTEPFKLVKTDKDAAAKIIIDLCERLYAISQMLIPILPQTATVIENLVKENKMPEKPLFLRK